MSQNICTIAKLKTRNPF